MVSSNDVARLAGVSQATVSRVLNNPEKVNAPTIERVNDAIQQLNYRPNAAARSLISRKSGIIALVCGPLEDPENAAFSGKAIAYAREAGFGTEIHIQDPHKPAAVFEAIVKTQAEGIIAGPLILVGRAMELLETSGIPYVFGGMAYQKAGHYVSMDNHAAGRMAADHICSLKHRIVGWLGGNAADPRLHDRYAGFLEKMKEQQVEILSAMGDIPDFDAVLSAMLARKNRPTAIVAATDAVGAYAIDFLIDFGYSIPEDITVLGIGNSKQSSMRYLNLSSIGLPEDRDVCREAMEQLTSLIAGETEEDMQRADIMPRLYQRWTSGPR
ncbi:MAG TPA: LacI family DNA-binding transcriptional regulator [Planococcus sp. (in: firmicutes)]|nr:LacI family DNA-binding transcriptional regulator [Planococcus sp. (in: firmicutes)]